ncbi:MAG: hypothetical protein D6806_04865 [Deltaproteobacteria bacterium]|nr:MAG: hypothetical protein D6806_04865 [Deltaproteobacteria bacterium]
MAGSDIFEPEEIVLAGKVLALLAGEGTDEAQASSDHLVKVMDQLARLRDVVTSYVSVVKPHKVAGQQRDLHTLVEAICKSNPYTIEAIIPTRAVVGRAYMVAKFNFLRLLGRVVRHHVVEKEARKELISEIDYFVRQAVATIIAEDILISIAGDEKLELDLRRKATFVLADLWEHRTSKPVREFFPVLSSVWEAKSRFTISYGTLSGTSEMLALMREGCHSAAIDYFTSESLTSEEREALIELVFNATYEELETMRRYMAENGLQVLSPEDVARLFNVPLSRLHRTISSPKDMFFTFRERQVNAYHRLVHNLPGPKKTAEEYLMIYLLRNSDISPPEIDMSCPDPEDDY